MEHWCRGEDGNKLHLITKQQQSRDRMRSTQGFFYRISSGQLCHNKKECFCRQKHLWCIKKKIRKTVNDTQRSSPALIITCQKDSSYKAWSLGMFMIRLATHTWTQPAENTRLETKFTTPGGDKKAVFIVKLLHSWDGSLLLPLPRTHEVNWRVQEVKQWQAGDGVHPPISD